MIYLEKEYLNTHIFERLLDESSEDFEDMLDNAELEQIGLIKSMLYARYNVNLIFDESNPIKNEVLKRILSKLVIYDAVRRNAARKVPSDYKEEYEWAMAMLEKLAVGKILLDDLPKPQDNPDNPNNGKTMWGNNSNPNFYI